MSLFPDYKGIVAYRNESDDLVYVMRGTVGDAMIDTEYLSGTGIVPEVGKQFDLPPLKLRFVREDTSRGWSRWVVEEVKEAE